MVPVAWPRGPHVRPPGPGSPYAGDSITRNRVRPDAGLELLRRIVRQTERMAKWQPSLMGEDGKPAFNISFYILDTKGRWAGVRMKGHVKFAVADVQGGPRHESQEPLFE